MEGRERGGNEGIISESNVTHVLEELLVIGRLTPLLLLLASTVSYTKIWLLFPIKWLIYTCFGMFIFFFLKEHDTKN